MPTITKYVAPLLAAAAISGAIGLAPVALAAPSTGAGTTTATPVRGQAPTPDESGVDPLVPADTGANPFVFVPSGQGLAF
jgi:hypothetical protein